jgi:hypothetical protein
LEPDRTSSLEQKNPTFSWTAIGDIISKGIILLTDGNHKLANNLPLKLYGSHGLKPMAVIKLIG